MLDWLRKAIAVPVEPPVSPGDSEVERPVVAVLADQLRELRHRQDSLELAWTDTLDKLVAREERERKRLSKALKKAVTPEEEANDPPTDDRSSRLRAIRARVAASQRGA